MLRPIFVASCATLLLSCNGVDSTSALKITNGIKRQPKSLTAVVLQDGCTGTFVSPTTILTAAHCADHGFTYNGVKTKSFKSFADHRGVAWDFSTDVRVLVFPKAVAPAWIPVSTQAVKKDEQVVYAGYGTYDLNNSKYDGKFRFGTNKVAGFEANDHLIQTYGAFVETIDGEEGLGSSVGPGDSGGPLLRDGLLIGIASAIANAGNKNKAIHVNLTNPEIKQFLDEMNKEGADIRFDGKGTNEYEECVDVDATQEMAKLEFDAPHYKVSRVEGSWSTCVCDECPETDAAGYTDGVYKDYRPIYQNVPAGALLLWGKKVGDATDKTYEKAGFMTKEGFEFKQHVFGVNLSIHAKAGTNRKGKLKVCFL